MSEEKIHRLVQKRYSYGHHKNQPENEGPDKELKERGRTTILPIISNKG